MFMVLISMFGGDAVMDMAIRLQLWTGTMEEDVRTVQA